MASLRESGWVSFRVVVASTALKEAPAQLPPSGCCEQLSDIMQNLASNLLGHILPRSCPENTTRGSLDISRRMHRGSSPRADRCWLNFFPFPLLSLPNPTISP